MHNAIQQPAAVEPSVPTLLDAGRRQLLAQAIEGLSREQIHWASGYLAGLGETRPVPHPALGSARAELTILYASQTGNAQLVAQQVAAAYRKHGVDPKLISAADYRPRDLTKEEYLLLVISTQGEGEAPESAFALRQYLFSDRAPRLADLNYAVFALGDSSYPDYCQAGKDFDRRLRELGARSLLERVDADVDFSAVASDWERTLIEHADDWFDTPQSNVITLNPEAGSTVYNRNHPAQLSLLERCRITGDDALSEVFHLELSLENSGLRYQPGDSLAVLVRNDAQLVEALLERFDIDAATQVTLQGQRISIEQALLERLELTQLHPSVIRKWQEIVPDGGGLKALTADSDALNQYAGSHQFIDLVEQFPGRADAATLARILLPLQPRLYSIASSQASVEDEVHLTVTSLSFQGFEAAPRHGSASGFLNQRIDNDQIIDAYVVENNAFRLPQSDDTPVIMIAAGSGIAPFRAFLQQRAADAASGDNWLVFGNRHFHRDFLYQSEWLKYRNDGLLNRISVAFSRDSEDKVYVQHRLLEEAETFNQWLERGAHIYVCGSHALDHSVHAALEQILQQQRGLSATEAQEFINQLRAEGRYARDVY